MNSLLDRSNSSRKCHIAIVQLLLKATLVTNTIQPCSNHTIGVNNNSISTPHSHHLQCSHKEEDLP